MTYAPKYPTIFRPVATSIRVVCAAWDIEPAALLARRQHRRWVRHRALVFWLARHGNLAYEEIGRRAGGYDHATVRRAWRLVERHRAIDPGYYVMTEWLLAAMGRPELISDRTAPEAHTEASAPEGTQTPDEPEIAASDALWGDDGAFCVYGPKMERAPRSFLFKQNERFLAALAQAGERPC